MRIIKTLSLITLLLIPALAFCQATSSFGLVVVNEKAQPVDGATVKLLKNAQTVKTIASNAKGLAQFDNLQPGAYYFLVSHTGYQPQTSKVYRLPSAQKRDTIRLQPQNTMLQEVSVVTRNPPIQRKEGKVVLDMEASVTNTGLSVLEVLERSPGVTVDKNGNITLQGKPGVMVMVDDKPTYLSGSDLNDMLNSMNSAQVAQIELIANPTARYDASGNAGIINIKTKKNKQVGFNGSFTTAEGQGVYPKSNNSLVLNYRVGKVNTFFNYSMGYIKYLTDIYAYRKYLNSNDQVTSILDQPSYFAGSLFNNTIKTGLDYYITPKTTIGIALTGTSNTKDGNNSATATWLNTGGGVDSAIATTNKNNGTFKNGLMNVSLRQNISPTQDLSADLDLLRYSIGADQDYNNHLLAPGGYNQLSRSEIPTSINITSGKVDYTLKTKDNTTLQMGAKASHSSTDNSADYQNFSGGTWTVDNTRSNHFIYSENVSAVYASVDKKKGRLSGQFGLRYEHTDYHAHQLGNALQKDSAFSRRYGSLFPSGYLSYQADTANNFTLTVSRRIDRPAFQKLNPFYQIINKYTYQTGNAYILPQYSLNFELSHQYKNWLTTTLSYADISDYFSQIFLADANKGILLYTQGNVGHAYNLGLSSMVIASPAHWWSLTGQAVYNHKQMKGFNGNTYTTTIDQLNLNLNNQLTLSKTYTAEVSGTYTTKMRVDLQELVYPSGQVSVGITRPVMQKKGTLKLTARDIFYTVAYEGLTTFPNATEYFKLTRDTRVVTLAFTYRFGKAYKAAKRSDGSAGDVIQRVGNGS